MPMGFQGVTLESDGNLFDTIKCFDDSPGHPNLLSPQNLDSKTQKAPDLRAGALSYNIKKGPLTHLPHTMLLAEHPESAR